ncbi:MAG: hypothetical protein EAZ77_08610 [Nostocales cyanobacterium]|nr:MAG: hypothetical protein EAZ77_08610 [Nostocales cyanobacterium]
MATTYKQQLSPWEVRRLSISRRGTLNHSRWEFVTAFRSRTDAEQYAKILRLSSINQIEVVFNG